MHYLGPALGLGHGLRPTDIKRPQNIGQQVVFFYFFFKLKKKCELGVYFILILRRPKILEFFLG